jgi:hypothetical protein
MDAGFTRERGEEEDDIGGEEADEVVEADVGGDVDISRSL